MYHLIFTIFFTSKQCSGQLGYGDSGYCSNCVLSNSGAISQGFHFGGSNYASNAANSDLANQISYSLPISDSFFIPSSTYNFGSNGYGAEASYVASNPNYGYPSTMSWYNAYNSAGNYGAGNGYPNCHNNNCLSNTGFKIASNALASNGTGNGISGSSTVYNSYSSLPDISQKKYSLPAANSVYSNSGSLPKTYTGNSHAGLETSYTLPAVYSNYPTIFSSYY